MTIVAYRSSMDVDVQFEDGTTRNNVRYDNFKNGHVANPNFNHPNAQRKRGSISMAVELLLLALLCGNFILTNSTAFFYPPVSHQL